MAEGDIEKVTVAEQDAHQAVQFFSDYAAEESSRLKEQAEKEAGLLAAAYSPFRALIEGDPQAVSAFQELESVLKQEDLGSIPAQADDLFRYVSDPLIEALPAAAPGVQVFGPPYAFEWKKTGSSSATAHTDKANGTFSASELVGPTSERFQTEAALGFAMRSPTTLTVRISAYMPISFEIDIQPYRPRLVHADVHARIGVFRDDGRLVVPPPPPALLYELTLPTAHRAHDYGETYISHTPLAHARLRMEANRTYTVWHDGIVGAIGNLNRVSVNIACRLPFIVVAPV